MTVSPQGCFLSPHSLPMGGRTSTVCSSYCHKSSAEDSQDHLRPDQPFLPTTGNHMGQGETKRHLPEKSNMDFKHLITPSLSVSAILGVSKNVKNDNLHITNTHPLVQFHYPSMLKIKAVCPQTLVGRACTSRYICFPVILISPTLGRAGPQTDVHRIHHRCFFICTFPDQAIQVSTHQMF